MLRKMRHDIEEKDRLVLVEERRQKRLISQMERKSKKETEEERLIREAAEREEDEALAREEKERMDKLKSVTKRSTRVSLLELAKPKNLSSKRESIRLEMDKRASMRRSLSKLIKPNLNSIRNPTMHGKSHPGGKDALAQFRDGRTGILDDDLSSKVQSSVGGDSSVVSSSVSGGLGEDGSGKGISAADQKLFTKIKRGKLGNADPATLLTEEAKRLQDAEVSENWACVPGFACLP